MSNKFIVLILITVLFVGCNEIVTQEDLGQGLITDNKTGTEVVSRAKILDIYENSVLMCGVEGEIETLYSLTTMNKDNLPIDARAGSIIDIYFDGLVMESYPARISNIIKIEVFNQEGDYVGLFTDILKELNDLNNNSYKDMYKNIRIQADTKDILSKDEKNGLTYIVGNKIDIANSFQVTNIEQELEFGLDTENTQEMLLFNITVNEIDEQGFTFDIGISYPDLEIKNGYLNCRVNFNDGELEYTKGEEYIS